MNRRKLLAKVQTESLEILVMHMLTSRVVPGREDILILEPYFLEKHDGSHYLPKARRTAPFFRRGAVHNFTALAP